MSSLIDAVLAEDDNKVRSLLQDEEIRNTINDFDDDGLTALMYAVNISKSITKLLIDYGADVSLQARDDSKFTALIKSQFKYAHYVKGIATLLLGKSRVDTVNAKASGKMTALDWAIQRHQYYGNPAIKPIAQYECDYDISELLNAGATLNKGNSKNYSSLFAAIEAEIDFDALNAILNVIERFPDSKRPSYVNYVFGNGTSTLHAVVHKLMHPMSATTKDRHGIPLTEHWFRVAVRLIELGADVTIKDAKGRNVLEIENYNGKTLETIHPILYKFIFAHMSIPLEKVQPEEKPAKKSNLTDTEKLIEDVQKAADNNELFQIYTLVANIDQRTLETIKHKVQSNNLSNGVLDYLNMSYPRYEISTEKRRQYMVEDAVSAAVVDDVWTLKVYLDLGVPRSIINSKLQNEKLTADVKTLLDESLTTKFTRRFKHLFNR